MGKGACVLKILEEILVALRQLHGRPIVVLRIAVEVAGVVRRPESGHVWRFVAAAEDAEPVESAEPLVTLDVLSAVAKAAEAGGAVRLQQFAHQIFGHRIEGTRKFKFASQNLLIDAWRKEKDTVTRERNEVCEQQIAPALRGADCCADRARNRKEPSDSPNGFSS